MKSSENTFNDCPPIKDEVNRVNKDLKDSEASGIENPMSNYPGNLRKGEDVWRLENMSA
ncbi:hypothetical protein HHI36_020472, partial [Cryptolaemus montrouzieri]